MASKKQIREEFENLPISNLEEFVTDNTLMRRRMEKVLKDDIEKLRKITFERDDFSQVELREIKELANDIKQEAKDILDNNDYNNEVTKIYNEKKKELEKVKDFDNFISVNRENIEPLIKVVEEMKDKNLKYYLDLREKVEKLNKNEREKFYKENCLSNADQLLLEKTREDIKKEITINHQYILNDIIFRIRNFIGEKIINANLIYNIKGSCDGIIQGENKKIQLKTDIFGGWNIQRLHLRTNIFVL